MKPPAFWVERRMTPEEMRARLKPCPWCGAVEQEIAPGVFRNILHDYSEHPGMTARRTERMSTEELLGAVDTETLNRLGGEKRSMSEIKESESVRVALRELAEAALWAAEQPNPARSASGYSWFQCCIEDVSKLLGPIEKQVDNQIEETMDEVFPECAECAVYLFRDGRIERSQEYPHLCVDCGRVEERFRLEARKFWGRITP